MADPHQPQVLLALTSEADHGKAEALARALLQRRLVACVSLQPQQALYHWQGRLESAAEVQLLIKTDTHRRAALEAAVRELHSYDTPEWLVWSAVASQAYGRWLAGELAPSPDAGRPGP
ncbi:MAG: divalent-cation tolerance protein CutA [Cyanobacteriota bacterium]|nr:divalent-cation tolerance protein CutA [Cyanobacteriota bacterium]